MLRISPFRVFGHCRWSSSRWPGLPSRRPADFRSRWLAAGRPARSPRPQPRSRSASGARDRAGMERRSRVVRPSADGEPARSASRCEFPQLPRRTVAAGGAPRRLARRASMRNGRPDARCADHGLRRRAAGVHQVVLGLSRSPGDRRADRRRGASHSGPASRCVRCGRAGLWGRPPSSSRRSGASRSNYGTRSASGR